MDDCIESDLSERSLSVITFSARDIHAHCDQIFINHLVLFLSESKPKQDKYTVVVKSKNFKWSIEKSILELIDFDEQIHHCLFTRTYSNLPCLSTELFDIENRRKGPIEEITVILTEYFDILSALIEENIKICSCLNVLNFLEMNNHGEYTCSPSPSSSEDPVKPIKSYFSRITSSFRQTRLKHSKVFGIDLSLHMQKHNEKVPCIVYDCVTFIENNLATGIYRISSVSSQINQLKEMYDHKKSLQFGFDKSTDVNTVACLLKMYFRLLPRRLLNPLPEDTGFIKSENLEEQISGIRLFLNTLDPNHYRTTAFLMRHLKLISDNIASTNMDAANLALVWSPNLFKIKSTRDQINNMNGQNKSIELMIRHYKQIFELLSLNYTLQNHHSNDNSYGAITSVEDADYMQIRHYSGFSPSPIKLKDKRVRSEEPPTRSIMSSFKRNLKQLGNNMKLSFRNLVKVGNHSSSSLSSGSVEYVSHKPPQLDTSSVSLSMQMENKIFYKLHISSDNGRNSPYASISLNHEVQAAKAEMDTFSTDSLPFEASRYDNLENKRPMSG